MLFYFPRPLAQCYLLYLLHNGTNTDMNMTLCLFFLTKSNLIQTIHLPFVARWKHNINRGFKLWHTNVLQAKLTCTLPPSLCFLLAHRCWEPLLWERQWESLGGRSQATLRKTVDSSFPSLFQDKNSAVKHTITTFKQPKYRLLE